MGNKQTRTRDIRRQERQEELREKLKGAAYINNLNKINEQYMNAITGSSRKKLNLALLKDAWNLNMKLLGKLLPDEQRIELDAPEELKRALFVAPDQYADADSWEEEAQQLTQTQH